MDRAARYWLFDILDKIPVCEALTADGDLDAFINDTPRRLAVERAIEIISEASRHIDEADRNSEPDQPWQQIADLGNRLRHGYHTVSASFIWDVATRSVSDLKPAVERIYRLRKRPSDPWP